MCFIVSSLGFSRSFLTLALVFLYREAAFFAFAVEIFSCPSHERNGLSRFWASHSAFLGFVIQRFSPLSCSFLYYFLATLAASSGKLLIQNMLN